MRTRIKVCGIRRTADAQLAIRLGADYIGMVFADSPRQVTREQARRIRDAIPLSPLVGVFADAPIEELAATARDCGLDLLQLHGEESPGDCVEAARLTGLPVIKAFFGESLSHPHTLQPYSSSEYLLFDLDKSFLDDTNEDIRVAALWKQVETLREGPRRFILAGGLDQHNVRAAIQRNQPFCVDVSRGVEAAPGIKDPEKLRSFIKEVRR